MKHRIPRVCVIAGLLGAGAGAVACGGVARGETPVSGRALYGSCDSCHGQSGEGDASLGAPRIAGLPAWYLSAQVERFQNGLRGKHFDDAEGLRMRAMAKQMMSKAEIDAVSAYVAALPVTATAPTLTNTNTEGAAALYAVCATCHGPKGEGSEPQSAPPLAGMDDWYVARQIRKFQTGVRGTAKDDLLGPQMAAMSQAVAPGDVDSMAAHVRDLGK